MNFSHKYFGHTEIYFSVFIRSAIALLENTVFVVYCCYLKSESMGWIFLIFFITITVVGSGKALGFI